MTHDVGVATRASLLALCAAALAPAAASACPCGALVGPSAPITGAADRWGAAVNVSALAELGRWDSRSGAQGNPEGASAYRGVLDLAAAWRATPALELGLGVAAGYSAVENPGQSLTGGGLGDSYVRARHELGLTRAGWVPTGAAWAGLRAPTASRALNDPGLAMATGLGLGAWEASVGGELRWALGARVQLALSGEVGLRFAGLDGYSPGHRAAVTVTVVHEVTQRVSLTAGAGEWMELGVDGSLLRRTTVSVGAQWRASLDWRAMARVDVDPLVDGAGNELPAVVRASLGVAWAR